MYKLLIVDDDEIMREGIEKNIYLKEHGFQVVSTARNGIEALECIKCYNPHIVLSDIRMPFMDGLQLVEKISELYPKIKVVLLTGYDDFHYAKKALALKVTQYVMKYEDNDEILNAVKRASEEVCKETRITNIIEKSNDLLKNKFLGDIISGINGDNQIQDEAALFDISFEGSKYCVAVISIDDCKGFSKDPKAADRELLLFSMRNICEEMFDKKLGNIYFTSINQNLTILFNIEGNFLADINEYLKDRFIDAKEKIESLLRVSITVGVGSVYEGCKNISLSYSDALVVLGIKDVMRKGGVIISDDIKNNENSHYILLKHITDFINKNYFNRELSLNCIAEEVHISPTYISTLFKKYKGINLSEYLINTRMEKAIDILLSTDMKTYEIAEKVGYSNPQYFSVLFKKYTGNSPSDYRNLKSSSRQKIFWEEKRAKLNNTRG